MSRFQDDYVFEAPPKSLRAIIGEAEAFLQAMRPAARLRPLPLQGAEIANYIEQKCNISVIPVNDLADRVEAQTVLEPPVQIWIEERQEEALYNRNWVTPHAKVTLLHEAYHAVFHAPFVESRRSNRVALARSRRGDIPAYLDPEWQAFAFACSVLMPLSTLRQLKDLSPGMVARTYEVSVPAATSHLKRLRAQKLI